MLKSDTQIGTSFNQMLSKIKSENQNFTEALIGGQESGDNDSEQDNHEQTHMEVDISQAIKSSSSISSSSSLSTSSISPKNSLSKAYTDEDDMPIDLSAKKSRLNNYYSATVAALAMAMAAHHQNNQFSNANSILLDTNQPNHQSSSNSSSCSTCESPSPLSNSINSSSSSSSSSFSPPPTVTEVKQQKETANSNNSHTSSANASSNFSHFLQNNIHQSFLNLQNQSLIPYFLSSSFQLASHFPAALQNFNPQQQQQHTPAGNSTNQAAKSRTSLHKTHSISPLLSHLQPQADQKPSLFNSALMRTHLKSGVVQSVLILHAKVAQKSYGNEKRFFCPPPCIYLTGNIWKTPNASQAAGQNITPKHYHNSKSNNNAIDTSMSSICTFIGINNSEREMQPLMFDNKNFAAAKTMFISDSDKRKHFKLLMRTYYKNGLEIGSFFSNSIKSNLGLLKVCIASGTKIALFNRLRSQTVSTRYLFCENGVFYASSQQWGSFYMYLVDDNGCESEEFIVKEGFIHYGATIKLVCTVTGMALPRLVIRKVDKSQVVVDARDALSQLHKCSFYLKDSDKMYLCLSQDKIIQFQATSCLKETNREIINDGACWTIISTDEVKYSWAETMGPPVEPVTPIPSIHSLKNNYEEDKVLVELKGENFNSNLKIWIDDVECQTIYKSSNSLRCVIEPKLSGSFKRNSSDNKAVLTLVRQHDGIIYNTGYHYNYSSKSAVCTLAPSLKQRNNSQNDYEDSISNKETHDLILPRTSLKRHSLNF